MYGYLKMAREYSSRECLAAGELQSRANSNCRESERVELKNKTLDNVIWDIVPVTQFTGAGLRQNQPTVIHPQLLWGIHGRLEGGCYDGHGGTGGSGCGEINFGRIFF